MKGCLVGNLLRSVIVEDWQSTRTLCSSAFPRSICYGDDAGDSVCPPTRLTPDLVPGILAEYK